jgi:hypothetical protein
MFMQDKLVRASELAEYVYCSQAWHLRYIKRLEVSPQAKAIQASATLWHQEQGQLLARGDSYRWAALAALLLAATLFLFVWLRWA